MQVGMIGLGRMGASMVGRLLQGGHECVVFDMKPDSVEDLARKGATGAAFLRIRKDRSPAVQTCNAFRIRNGSNLTFMFLNRLNLLTDRATNILDPTLHKPRWDS